VNDAQTAAMQLGVRFSDLRVRRFIIIIVVLFCSEKMERAGKMGG
jgi:hypothetical protein